MDKDERRSLKVEIKRLTEIVFDPKRTAKIMELIPDLEPPKLSALLYDTRNGRLLKELQQLLEAA